ncbi:hypothetical protein [Algisphaera agarilytica]|uniref:Uncharacterized protein n=1 Tax=Algisphaera agarilytica TaxID=1385975 RepID=A0A7X0LK34_9BACT|nr:hypothetical protein [Algisphaera agarilytica]MBB6429226.1 hypothetical protein [Algisphaera agarilytica]
MAQISCNVQLNLSHEPTDKLLLFIGTGHGLTLAESGGGKLLADQVIGAQADASPAAVIVLSGSHRPPNGCAVLALGVSVQDEVGNVSELFETFVEVVDHPRGVDTNPVEATANTNEAIFNWTESPDLEGVS